MEKKERLIIFDTTLRDGEQSPGVTLNADEKVTIAKQLSRMGVDVCEAGFPIASEGDFEAVKRIATEVGGLTEGREDGHPMVICALARATEGDILRAFEAIKPAKRKRIHTFLATSDIHLEYKLKIGRDDCIARVKKAVSYAASLCEDVEFSAEDAGRSDKDFLTQVLATAIKAGAKTLNIPDTVGYNTPEEYGKTIRYLIEKTEGSHKVVWSTHCHNDLGLATANTLAGIVNGARQVEVTMNGIGERAGNTSLEEVVMTLRTHPTLFSVHSVIDTTQIYRTSMLVSALTGMVIQPNKAIVGANAFAHESGIHQDGVLKHASTYEIIKPETIGLGKSSLVLGKHSGRHAFSSRLSELGYKNLDQKELDAAFTRFKKLADSKKIISDFDLHALMKDELYQPVETYKLKTIQITAGSNVRATATIEVETPQQELLVDAAIGNGPVDAVFKAINRIANVSIGLAEYEVRAITGGSDAIGEVSVRIKEEPQTPNSNKKRKIEETSNGNGHVEEKKDQEKEEERGEEAQEALFHGHGADSDILTASAKAYMAAINRMLAYRKDKTSLITKDITVTKRRREGV